MIVFYSFNAKYMNKGPLIYPILIMISAYPGTVKDSNNPNIQYKKTPRDNNKNFFRISPVAWNALIKKPIPRNTIIDSKNTIISIPAGDPKFKL